MKLLLIDGHNLLFQMFYGMPARIKGKDGTPIQGVLGFIGATLKIIRQLCPSHICIVFDGEHENPRTELLASYKANRKDYSLVPEEDNPFAQLTLIYKALDYLQIPYIETKNQEADDIIASFTKKYESIMQIIIVSGDSDFFSLISENTQIYRYRGKQSYFCNKEYLEMKYGIAPNQYILFKSLIGDASDNIKGVLGIGPKTAASIVSHYPTYDTLTEELDAIQNKKIREKIKNAKDILYRNQQLIQLQITDVLPFTLENLEYTLESGITSTSIMKALSLWE